MLYRKFLRTVINGLELRKLKYELFNNTEHRKFFPTRNNEAPGIAVYISIFEDKRILLLCRYIGNTAIYFEDEFTAVQQNAELINDYIDEKYNYEVDSKTESKAD